MRSKDKKTFNPKEVSSLALYRQEKFVGNLLRTEKGIKIIFDKQFLNDPGFIFLSYHISKKFSEYEYNGAGLPPFFAGLLPEGWRFKALVKKIKTSEDDLFSLLAAVGKRTIGDVWVDNLSEEHSELELSHLDFYELLNRFHESRDLTNEDAIAGVQSKISSSMLSLPIRLRKKKKQYILKLNPSDKPSLVQNEHYTLLLAKKVGIKVNSTKVIKDKNGNPGLLVERFDRYEQNNEIKMYHQEDMCQLLNLYPADKYRISMQQIVECIKKISPSWKIEVLKTIELYIFCYLVGNGDLHGKNISLYWKNDFSARTLTPAYDLISTTIFGDHKMSLKLDGRDSNFKRSHFIKFGERYGLAGITIDRSLDRIMNAIKMHNYFFDKIAFDEKSKKWLHKSFEQKAKDLTS
jgi:serine/threonine-protein kinase HipA